MKKFSLAILALVLVLGFALSGCNGGNLTDVPIVTAFTSVLITGTSSPYTYTPASSFTEGQVVGFEYSFTNPYQDAAREQLYIKKGEDVWFAMSYLLTGNISMPKGSTATKWHWGWYTLPAGSYTAEYYVEDIDGNRSATATTSFTVTAAD